jgi:hypothetical protein
MNNVEKFSEKQEEIIEKRFNDLYPNVRTAVLLLELTKTSLVDANDCVNEKTCPHDTKAVLEMVTDLLGPLKGYISELSLNGKLLLDENFFKTGVLAANDVEKTIN